MNLLSGDQKGAGFCDHGATGRAFSVSSERTQICLLSPLPGKARCRPSGESSSALLMLVFSGAEISKRTTWGSAGSSRHGAQTATAAAIAATAATPYATLLPTEWERGVGSGATSAASR